MENIAICGHFAENINQSDGQTVKTRMLKVALEKELELKVNSIDTFGWKKKPLSLLINLLNSSKNNDHMIILPAHNGLKVFVPLFSYIKKLLKIKVHYVVIGGWLPQYINEHKWILRYLNNLDGIYVETNDMISKLEMLGLKNIFHMPNFKNIKIVEKGASNKHIIPYKICTLSRVIKEKGIEDIIDAVEYINLKYKSKIYELDIYGPIDEVYSKEFEKKIFKSSEYIRYKGVVDANETVEVIKDYFMLIFPTKFRTEGIPGTIIDAYSAGIPVLASEWDYVHEIIDENKDGIIYEFGEVKSLIEKLEYIKDNSELILRMKDKCIEKAYKYSSKEVIKKFIHNMKYNSYTSWEN